MTTYRKSWLFAFVLVYILTFCSGCSNTLGEFGNSLLEGFNKVNIFTDEEEQQFGKAYAEQHARKVKFYTDPIVNGYINDLGQRLVKRSKRNNITYTFKVVHANAVNAYAVPGGFM